MTDPMTIYENSVVAAAQAALQRVLRQGIKDDDRRRELEKVAVFSMLHCYMNMEDHFTLEISDSPREFFNQERSNG